MYKLIMSNVTISVFSSTFLGHLSKKSKLLPIKLLMRFKKGFNSISINCLSFLVGHLGSPTIGLGLRSFGSKSSMISLFWLFIADYITIDL